MSKRLIFLTIVASIGGLIVSLGLAYATPAQLEKIAVELAENYDMIEHITSDDLEALMHEDRQIILLDTRKPAEYRVSHIEGAIRIAPNANIDELMAVLPGDIKDAEVVFYCSVGARSSRVAKRSKTALQARGVSGIYNLRGGLFDWHNEARPLVNEDGPTDLIHPFSRYWGRLLSRRELASKHKEEHDGT